MARIAVISDIHGNLEALQAVLKALKRDGVDSVVHLGDLVGYNANPRETLGLLHTATGAVGTLGNHDLGVFEPETAESFNVLAHQALLYSMDQLTDHEVDYLRTLPLTVHLNERYLFCHGTPESVHTYIMNLFQAKRTFNLLRKRYPEVQVCFHGHTHIQRLWIRDHRGKVMAQRPLPGPMSLDPDHTYLINPGSVGQPRQRDNRAHYLILDTDRKAIIFRAVPYDIGTAQAKILKAGLPDYLALRLLDGI